MSVARCREINARLRAVGITVHEWPGWEKRGNGQSPAYEGGLVHHTATDFGMALPGTGVGTLLVNGRPDLSGPLCNYAGNADGSITVIAAQPANHAGASGGRSMGPLPTTKLFNRRVLGLEIVYPGTTPMRDAQFRSALAWCHMVVLVCGNGDIQRARAHAETSITGKFDPGNSPGRTINMAAFRAAAANPPEVDMALSDAAAADLVHRVNDLVHGHEKQSDGPGKSQTLEMVRDLNAAHGRIEALTNMQDSVTSGPTAGDQAQLVKAIKAIQADLAKIKNALKVP